MPFDIQEINVGRRTAELDIQYLSDKMLHMHYYDKQNGNSPDVSFVFRYLQRYFDLATLINVYNLWERMDQKLSTFGGCNINIPSPPTGLEIA